MGIRVGQSRGRNCTRIQLWHQCLLAEGRAPWNVPWNVSLHETTSSRMRSGLGRCGRSPLGRRQGADHCLQWLAHRLRTRRRCVRRGRCSTRACARGLPPAATVPRWPKPHRDQQAAGVQADGGMANRSAHLGEATGQAQQIEAEQLAPHRPVAEQDLARLQVRCATPRAVFRLYPGRDGQWLPTCVQEAGQSGQSAGRCQADLHRLFGGPAERRPYRLQGRQVSPQAQSMGEFRQRGEQQQPAVRSAADRQYRRRSADHRHLDAAVSAALLNPRRLSA